MKTARDLKNREVSELLIEVERRGMTHWNEMSNSNDVVPNSNTIFLLGILDLLVEIRKGISK